MKLIAPIVASAAASKAYQESTSLFPASRVCGQHTARLGSNMQVNETVTLNPGEQCIYRFRGTGLHMMQVNDFAANVNCDDGEVFLITDETVYGPFCEEGDRHRRDAGGYNSQDMMGQNFKSKEMDMVLSNGQRARFRFGFNFEFELLPGLPYNGGGQCPFKGIKAANAAFYNAFPDNSEANKIFNELTESMYNFNCYFDKYRDQCKGNGPATVSCHLMKFDDKSKPVLGRVEAIIDAQCASCRGGSNAICTDWYMMLAQIKYKCQHYTDPVTPAPCGPDECYDGTDTCGDHSICTNTCESFTCECEEGYHMEDGYCVPDCDEDQCETGNNDCHANASCVNKCDGYECVCNNNWYGNGKECCDENQCDTNNGGCGDYATCENKCVGHKCVCIDGYHKDKNNKCVPICDEDQCKTGNNDCDANANCVNECSGYKCVCKKNFYGNGKNCCDENQCDKNPCGKNTLCTDQCIGHKCECKKDYIPGPGAPYGNGKIDCVHKNKCHNVKCQAYASCDGKDGKCYCNKGYYNDNGVCKPKTNECITGAHNCAVYANCIDTLESYKCECHQGYEDVKGDGTECTHPYYLNTGMCFLNEYSKFTNKRFEQIAYKTAYGVQEAINAWETITAELDRLGDIAANHRTVECDELAGKIGCGHINYENDSTACDWAHSLENVIAQVQKKCNKDWKDKFIPYFEILRKNTCDEPDDCAAGNHNCHKEATCASKEAVYGKKVSGFKCTCNAGFYGNGRVCYPEVDECAEDKHRCHKWATCVDKSAGYDCVCNEGYVGNGYKCAVPVNECTLPEGDPNRHDCHEYADCVDLDNGFMCVCRVKEGYTGDGRQCTGPANECAEGTHLCNANAECTNTYAGYTCKCNEGYLGDGKACWLPLTCPWGADLDYGTYGGDYGRDDKLCSLKYSKVCWKSLYQDLILAGVKFCKKNDAFTQFTTLINDLFNHGKLYDQKYFKATAHASPAYQRYGAECDAQAGAVPCHLVNFHNIVDAADLYNRVEALANHVYGQCTAEYKAKWTLWLARYYNALICPVNECKTGDYTCHANAKCVDQAKGYDCVCQANYEGNGYDNCTPIDWCARQGVCNAYANCVSGADGVGYTCECHAGYSGKKCLPDDPCDTNNGGCHEHANCKSTIIGYDVNHVCKCKVGYYGSGKVCAPIDPCEYHNCDANAACVPHANVATEEDYECKCNTGYTGNGYYCEEYVSPCDDVVCIAEAECQVVKNQYGQEAGICVCSQGFKGDGNTCQPIGPCDDNNCHPKATCKPNGSVYSAGFTCVCNDGLSGDGVNNCGASDECAKCDNYAKCKVQFGYSGAPIKKCECTAPYIGDGYSCKLGAKCKNNCPAGTTCWDGKCLCPSVGLYYNWGTKKCLDKDECKSGKNNCSKNADCKNSYNGFTCTCKNGYIGDGVTCGIANDAGAYQDAGNPYLNPGTGNKPDLVSQGDFANADGTDISLFANFGDGECSLMGFNWMATASMAKKMQWVSTNKQVSINNLNYMFKEFQSLGKAVLVRQQPSCDLDKAGKIDCNLLYFPLNEHRCQLIRRIEKVYKAVAQNCNQSWIRKFGGMMDQLVKDAGKYKAGQSCPEVEWL